MLSKNKIKYFKTFQQKKHRDNARVFIVEGPKMFKEALGSQCKIIAVVASSNFLQTVQLPQSVEVIETYKEEIAKISCLKTPTDVWALVERIEPINAFVNVGLILALDGIQDPGNMGTILRIADWFSITNIVCSNDCVDVFNPKVVQASMGAIFRLNITFTDLPDYLSQTSLAVYGAFLEGENIYNSELNKDGVIVMGNEGNGISDEVEKYITKKIHIPSGPESKAESLNVAVATSIICSEFFRRV